MTLWYDPLGSSRRDAVNPLAIVTSPNRQLRVAISSGDYVPLSYQIAAGNTSVIERSWLGILVDGVYLGQGAAIRSGESYSINERYAWRGVHSEAVNRANGVRFSIDDKKSGTKYVVEVRAFNDAVAFRHVIPGTGRRVPDAGMIFRLPKGTLVWYHGLRDHYEALYERRAIDKIKDGEWAAPPVTFKLPSGAGYGSITEADLRGYAGMALQSDGAGAFRERLAHTHPPGYPFTLRFGEEEAKRLSNPAAVDGAITTPWRVVMVARDLNTLVNSDVVHNLAAPPDSKLFPQGVKTAWLKPGRAVWRYLDGGENTLDGIKEFSRLAGELGFEYQVVEGQWQKWTDAELRDLVQYSKARGVGIMVWRHRRTLGTPEDRRKLFASLRNAGVVGVKVDFLDHEAKEVIDLYQDILRDAAEHQLMVNFHGANKPAGEARTWPNEMTREAIYGLEHKRIEAWAAFNSTFPFTRMLAGHADYTPVVFGERRRETSIAHQIASAAILTSPLLVYGGHPASLLASPAVEIIKSIPSVWDETRVLQPSEIGELALFARRSGTAWFVAAMNGPTAQTVKVSLSFLPKGTYQALVARDNAEDVAAVVVERGTRTAGETLEIPMRAGGGFVVRLHPSGASVSTAKITGPIPSTTAPGDRSHNYPFFSTKHLVEKDDYVEEEFYVEGLAVEYAGAVDQTATVAPGGPYPYKTRAIVRRPKSARRFNGTVILEWTNVAAGFGIDNDWYWSHEHLMRRGFAHIGVIVEPAGIHSPRGLKQWNPGRYGSLDLTANGTFSNLQAGFELSFSIFSQVARAIKNPSGVGLLRNLKARNVVATGHSRSSGRLSAYYNRIHPSDGIVDGFVFHGAGGLIRTDIRTPAWKLLAETDVIWAQAPIRQPDSPYFRTWEVAGASHADWDLMRVVDDLGKRDLTPPDPAPCDPPDGSRVPSRLAQDALYDWMKLWVERRTPPPQAPQIALSSIGTRETGPNAPPSSVARRDEHGNAQGGIRLAQFAVATATNTGLRSNTPPGNCRNRGVYTPFTADTIARLYPTRAKYIAEVHRITDENLKAGYITKEGATQTKNDAAQWKPGAQ